jgi:hypothetical protein
MGAFMDYKTDEIYIGRIVSFALLIIALGLFGGCYLYPHYSIWENRMHGMAELSRAEQNRQIRVTEAQAKLESSKLDAQSEVERAKGVAAANQIIGEGLKGHEEYLRYLWIMSLEHVANSTTGSTVVYVPTEAKLPILEAQRLK